MAASAAYAAKGTCLIRDTFLVAELSNLGSPPSVVDLIEVTSHDSDSDYREFVAGLLDGGEISLEGNFIPGDTNGQIGMLTDMQARTLRTFIIAFPNGMGSSWSFSGYVSKFETSAPFDGKVNFASTIRVVGKPTLVTTASVGLTTPFFTLKDSADVAITPSPAAANAVYEYTATALTGATHIHVTPTATAGVIHVNGVVVVTGADSAALPLGAAGTYILVTVRVTETNKAPIIYRITVLRAAA